jgi:hypothetical protein
MKRFVTILIVGVLIMLTAAAQAGDLGLKQLLDQPIERELFPGKYDKLLDSYGYPEDRVLAVFRAWVTAKADAKNSAGAFFLDRALTELGKTQTALFKRELVSATDPAGRMAEWLDWWKTAARLPEKAAFAQLFRILPGDFKTRHGLTVLETEALAQEQALLDPSALAAFARAIPEKQHYSRQIRRVFWGMGETKEAFDKVLARVKFAFSSENLIRFAARARKTAKTAGLQQALGRLQDRLTRDLIDEIMQEFAACQENDLLGSEITMIGLTKNGNLITKESLLKGRLRLLVKRAQLLETATDRAAFTPIFDTLVQRLTAAAGANARTYVGMVTDTLKLMSLLKLRRLEQDEDSPATKTLFKQVSQYLTDQDQEAVFKGLAAD